MTPMPRQAIVTGSAIGLAVLVLAATFLLSERPAPPTDGDAPGNGRAPSDNADATGPGNMAAPLDPDASDNPDPRVTPFSSAGSYHYQINQDGKLIELFGEKLQPLPQGVYRVSQPGARVHLIPGRRIIQMRAPRGRFVAPENQPQSGEFHGDVVITLFDAPPGRSADLSPDSPDIRVVTYLQGATFDVELGLIESAGPVHLTGPRIDFRGEGLSITYNTLLGRIEQMRIEKGQSLRVKTQGESLGGSRTQAGDQAAVKAAGDEPQRMADAQYYRARFLDDVRVRSDEFEVTGNALEAVFAMDDRSTEDDMIEGLGSVPPSPRAAPGRFDPANALAEASGDVTPALASADAASPSLIKESPDDVVITWTGPLVLTPEPGPSPDMTGPGQAVLAAIGDPAVVTDDRGRRIEAASVRYVTGSGRVAADGSLDRPVDVAAPELGHLTAQSLWIDPTSQRGEVYGPGQIQAADNANPHDTDGMAMRNLRLTWGDRLALAFTPKPGDGPDERGELRELAIASFNGDAVAEHPGFILKADNITARPNDPDRAITAAGNVRAQGRPNQATPDAPAGTLTCGKLAVALDENNGNARPRRVTAEQDVVAAQPGRRIAAQWLTLEFQAGADTPAQPIVVPDPAPAFAGWTPWPHLAQTENEIATTQPATTEPADASPGLVARRITARDTVAVTLQEQGVTLTANKLVAISDDKLHLFGSADRPAALARHGGQLTGQHIVFDPRAQTARVNGPGVLTHDNDRLALQWSHHMLLDNRAGSATFTGDVLNRTLTEDDTVSTRLSAQRLTLTFPESDQPIGSLNELIQTPEVQQPPEATPSEPENDASAATQPASPDESRTAIAEALMGDRALQRMVADGGGSGEPIEFVVERWTDGVGGEATARVRVKGPNLTFDNQRAMIKVDGAGSMLFQDNRPPERPLQADQDDAQAPAEAAFTGRGVTAFVWDDAMSFDADQNDATLRGNVRMVHRPAGEQDVLQMDCDRVVADLTTTGGIPGWLSGRGVQPQLQAVRASGNVFIKSQQRRIRADVLDYLANDRTVELVSREGRMTQINFDENRPPLRAERFRWHLDRDRYEILRPGAGRIGVGQ